MRMGIPSVPWAQVTEGWGTRLLAAQDADGQWSHALYSPKWTSTTYTLLFLRWLGLPSGHPQALAGCRQGRNGARFYDGGLTLAKSIRQPETCVTAILVLLAFSGSGQISHGRRLDRLVVPGNGQGGGVSDLAG